MTPRRVSLAFVLAFSLLPLAGCIGDDKDEPTGPKQVTNTFTGVAENVKITLEPTTFDVTGEVAREKRVRTTYIVGTVPTGQTTDYRFVWNFQNVLPLGTDSNKGEVYYQIWVGTAKGQEGDIQYNRLTGHTFSGFNGTVQGATGYAQHQNNKFFMLSFEAREDGNYEFPLVRIANMTDPEGKWSNAVENPFSGVFGDVKLGTPTADGLVNITLRTFELPKIQNNGYDAWLQTKSGVVKLGRVDILPALGATGVIANVEESKLVDWSVFVTYEPQTSDDVPSHLIVLKSKFTSK